MKTTLTVVSMNAYASQRRRKSVNDSILSFQNQPLDVHTSAFDATPGVTERVRRDPFQLIKAVIPDLN